MRRHTCAAPLARAALVLLVPLTLVACGGDDDGSMPPDELGLPDCALDEVHVVGTVMGIAYDTRVPTTGHAFSNFLGGAPGYLDVFDESRRFMKIELEDTLGCGQTKAARGWISLPSRGFDYGNCESDPALDSLIHQNGDCDSGGFVLRAPKPAPYCSVAAPVEGELRACWRFSPITR